MNQYLLTLDVDIPIKLNDLQKMQGTYALIKHIEGKDWDPRTHVSKEAREAVHNLAGITWIKATVGIRLDGQLEIINDD